MDLNTADQLFRQSLLAQRDARDLQTAMTDSVDDSYGKETVAEGLSYQSFLNPKSFSNTSAGESPWQANSAKGSKISFWVFKNGDSSPLEKESLTVKKLEQKIPLPNRWLCSVRQEWYNKHGPLDPDAQHWPPIKVSRPDKSESWILYPSWNGKVTLQTATQNVQLAPVWEPSQELQHRLLRSMVYSKPKKIGPGTSREDSEHGSQTEE
ncbi:hypothetical protein NliqN6_4440 [Naganishia liquefaciens]|uniref:Uncharacterized protein n=1 Tax=Naganishia liquefaciens TaxID=104408 RepID=A0A8H3TWA6_9TREE|nr:hypothetical protein NliqN6_4440 [Naganishia liquefaciens]